VSSATQSTATIDARWRAVEDHIRFEAARDLDALLSTFGAEPEWHNKPSNDVLHGTEAIRSFYGDLFAGFPDFWLDIRSRHTSADAIVVEGILGGTHDGAWMGIAATGKKASIPFCAVFTFTADDRIHSETAYYDRLTLLEQLGVIGSSPQA
jgi:steroid delta-isomerase-like uncharacterized protein